MQVYYGLMTVETDMNYDRELSLEERRKHLQRAEYYAGLAFDQARTSSKALDLAKVKFEQAILKGRRAEFESKTGTDLWEVRRLRDEALRAISGALQDLENSNYDSINEKSACAQHWYNRLKGL